MAKTIKEKNAEFSEVPLASELPFWQFLLEEKAIVFVDGSVGAGFKLSGLDVECVSYDEINQRTVALRSFLNNLPEGVVVQIIYGVNSHYSDVISAHNKGTGNAFVDWITQNRIEGLKNEQEEESLFRPHIYLFFRFWPDEKPVSKIKLFDKKKKFMTLSQSKHKALIEELNQRAHDLSLSLESAGIPSRRLSTDEIRSLVYDFLNPQRAKILPLS